MEKQTYILRDNRIRQNCVEAIQQISANNQTPLVVTISERTRTLEQNALLWACLHDISEQVIWHGRKLAPESWKHLFSASLNGQEAVPNLAGDGFVVLGKSTSKMRVGEMRDLIELIFAFGAEQGVKWKSDTWREYEQFQAR